MGAPRHSLSSERDVSDVMTRMDNFRQAGQETHEDKDAGGSRLLVALSCALSMAGTALLLCTLCVICVPDSSLAYAVISVCETLF